MKALGERFWSKVDIQGPDDCWEWRGGRGSAGYGVFSHDGHNRDAHRLVLIVMTGIDPPEMLAEHFDCRNPACVNPAHLRWATFKQNGENRRGARKDSRTGVRGVSPSGDKFQVRIKHNGVMRYYGTYETVAEAEAVAIATRNELFTHNEVDRKVLDMAASL